MVQLGISDFAGYPQREITICINPAADNSNKLVWLERKPIDLTATLDDVEELNKDFEIAVNNLAKRIDRNDFTYSELPELILDDLARTGRSALTTLFGPTGLSYLVRQLDEVRQKNDAPIIIVHSDVCYLPWEVLFWQDADQFNIEGSTDHERLVSVMSQFWALQYAIVRQDIEIVNTHVTHKDYTNSLNGIDIGSIVDANIPYANGEEAFLSSYVATFPNLRYSRFQYSNNFRLELNDFLHDTSRTIIHFACHAEPNNLSSNRSYIQYQGQRFELRDLTQRSDLMTASFLFLNACATGVRIPTQTLQFVQSFRRRKGVHNLLATEFVIETHIAREFSEFFYRHFLTGTVLGEAVQKARFDALYSIQDNIAIVTILFYSLYGNPYFKLNVQN